jgi:general secretion pathway protein D
LRDKESTRAVTNEKFDELWQLNLNVKEAKGEEPEDLQKLVKPPIDSLYSGMKIR